MFDLTLSFDNGPEPEVTPFVLDVLRARGLRATFFPIGGKVARPEGIALARRARDEGHWIGNHTWTHSVPLGLRPGGATVEDEIVRSQDVLEALTDGRRLFRPFGGGGNLDARLMSGEVLDHLVRERFTVVLWNAVPRDWADPDGWVETALRQVAERPWTLMVLHDLPTGAMRHLERFLDAVAARGARFRQDFPPDCVPVLRGEVVRPVEAYVTRGSAPSHVEAA